MSAHRFEWRALAVVALATCGAVAQAATPTPFGFDAFTWARGGGFAFGAFNPGNNTAQGTSPGITTNGFDSFIIDAQAIIDPGNPFAVPDAFGGIGGNFYGGSGILFNPEDYRLEVDYKILAGNETGRMNIEMTQVDGFDGNGDGQTESFRFDFYDIIGFADNNTPDADGFYTITRDITELPNPNTGSETEPWDFRQPAFDDPNDGVNLEDGDMLFDTNVVQDGQANGLVQFQIQTEFATSERLNIEVRSLRMVPKAGIADPNEVARFDNSALSFNYDSFSQPGAVSRDDGTSLTNIIIDAQDQGGDAGAFGGVGLRTSPSEYQFDGTEYAIEVTAKVLPNNEAVGFAILANDLDGDDTAEGQGGEQWNIDFDIADFSTTDFTTVTIPMTAGVLNDAFGFTFAGDGLLSDFDLYELQIQAFSEATERLNIEIESVRVVVAPDVEICPGDANGDGSVDLLDLDILGANFGTMGGATVAMGDFNADGNVDLLDLDILGGNFGKTTPSSIPEPTSLVMALGLGAFGLIRRRG